MADLLPRFASSLASLFTGLALLMAMPLLTVMPLWAQVPTSLSLATPTTLCTQDVVGQVNLNVPAPAAGLTVLFASSMPAVVAVPAAVTVPAGATSAPLRILRCTPTPQAVAVTISATVNGGSQSVILNVLAPTLSAVTFKTNATLPISFTGSAALQGPAPTGGVIVTLTNSHPSLVNVPTSVTIPAGATSANISMVAMAAVSQNTTVTITGTGLGATMRTTVVIPTAVPASLRFMSGSTGRFESNALTLPSGAGTIARLTLNGAAGPDGLSIKLSSSNSAIATVPPAVTVRHLDSVVQFDVRTVGQAQSATVVIGAIVGASSASGTLTLTGTTLTSLSVTPNPVIAGLTTQGRVTSSQAAGPGGLSVRLTSSNITLVQLPAIVTIPEGASTATFPVVTDYADAPRAITISATGGGVTQSTSVTLTPEGISAFSITPTRVIGGNTAVGRLSAPFGHNGFTVALVSNTPTFATVPASVIFTAQDTVKNFTITSIPTRVAETARITATVRSAATDVPSRKTTGAVSLSRTAEFAVSPPTVRSMVMTPTRIVGGPVTVAKSTTIVGVMTPTVVTAVFTGTVTLTGPAHQGMSLSLTSTDAAVVVPTSITFLPGATTATFTASTRAVTADKNVTISAVGESGGASATVYVTVKP